MRFPLFLLPFILLFIHSSPFTKAQKDDLIVRTCTETNFPDYCISSFRSDSRSSTADSKGLARLSIELALATAQNTLSFTKDQHKIVPNDDMKKRLADCTANYEDAIKYLAKASTKFESGNYIDAAAKVSKAITEAGKCREELRTPPTIPAVEKKCDEMGYACDTAFVIISILD
ncbi:pectinesterase inhibitor-like [Magnolia sinica]|uniref:pectinesterase inhibitor-like n=1 Tax=Magnolia sinica TaxID=86752 RepID=UPI00265AF522|nr:pectinesterase inhibitor-like [Magnolia sinica]